MSRANLLVSTIVLTAALGFSVPSDGATKNGKARVRAAKTQKRLPKTRANRSKTLRPQEITAEEAALLLPGKETYMQIGHGAPHGVLDAAYKLLKKRSSPFSSEKKLKLIHLSNNASPKIFSLNKPIRGRVEPKALFIGGPPRNAINGGYGEFIPIMLGEIPRAFRERTIPVDVAVLKVSPPDKDGYVSLGPSTAVAPAAIDAAKLVIAEVNENVPRTNGASKLHISQIDKIVKTHEQLKEVPAAKIGKTEQRIAKHIMKLMKKRLPKRGLFGTFQFGIGGVPDAVAGSLVKAKRKVRVHSEMISDGVRRLDEAGLVDGKINYTFFMGSKQGLDWLNDNPKAVAYPTEEINNVENLGQIDNFVAINAGVEVDTFGAVNAQMINDKLYSGIGGQVDFMRGAKKSKGGMAIIAMPATTTLKNGEVHSKIVWPWTLGKGGQGLRFTGPKGETLVLKGKQPMTTTSMHDLSYVVTEHGVAEMAGEHYQSVDQRMQNLIKVADPRFRPMMREIYKDWKATNKQDAFTSQAKLNALLAAKKANAAAKAKEAVVAATKTVASTVAAAGKRFTESREESARKIADEYMRK